MAVAMLALLMAGNPIAACADVRVEGDATALRLDVSKSQVTEVLSALSQTLNVRYSTTVALDRVISGTYSGSLERVISRLLDGYNYWVKKRGMTVEIVVIGTHGQHAVAASMPTPTLPKSRAAQWRTPLPDGPAQK